MCNTSKCFKQAFKNFISKRIVEDLCECLSNNEEYRRITSEVDTYADKIKASVNSKEFSLLFDRFDTLCGDVESLIANIMYMQGLRDGCILCSMLLLEGKGA